MKYRKLQIAWSVAFGVVAVLLLVLWVRSYWWLDTVAGPVSNAGFALHSMEGLVRIIITHPLQAAPLEGAPPALPTVREFLVKRESVKARRMFGGVGLSVPNSVWGFGIHSFGNGFAAMLPYWGIVLPFSFLAGYPWLRLRFSLRTLLIATTLAAVGLGVVVWATT